MKAKTPKPKKQATKYPTLTVRIAAEMRARLEALSIAADRSYGELVNMCLRSEIPRIEGKHNLVKSNGSKNWLTPENQSKWRKARV